MFFAVFSHAFGYPHKRHGWPRVGRKNHVPKGSDM